MALKSRNNLGQFEDGISILVTQEMQKAAKDVEVKIKPIIRDELDVVFQRNLRKSYSPITEANKVIKEQNDYAKKHGGHRQAASYHHIGLLASSTHAVIDGNVVKIVVEETQYPDGATTTQVYEWLTKGTTKRPKKNSYPYIKKQGDNYSTGWASYNPTPKHEFEQRTLEEMDDFLNNLMNNLKYK